MQKPRDNQAILRSTRIYARLLRLYPREHRSEFGDDMEQLFSDQCRDAWNSASVWGVVLLWLRSLIDLAKGVFVEHLHNFRKGGNMPGHLLRAFSGKEAPLRSFRTVFITIFVIILGTCVLAAIISPTKYKSMARIVVEDDPFDKASSDSASGPRSLRTNPKYITEKIELMLSDKILGEAARSLGLQDKIGDLRQKTQIKQLRDTRLLEISVSDKSSTNAAALANAISEKYASLRYNELRRARDPIPAEERFALVHMPYIVVDRAEAALGPISPNRPLLIFTGVFGGGFLALLTGAFCAIIARRRMPKNRQPPKLNTAVTVVN